MESFALSIVPGKKPLTVITMTTAPLLWAWSLLWPPLLPLLVSLDCCSATVQVALVVKNLPANANQGDVRDKSLIPWLGRSPGAGNGNPLQYSCLENPMDRGAWRPTVHWVAKSWTWLKRLSMRALPLPLFSCPDPQKQSMVIERKNEDIPLISTSIYTSNFQNVLLSNKSQWIRMVASVHFYFCFIDYAKAFDCVDHNKLWKILQEMGIADYLTCLLRNLHAGQEATVRTGHGTTDWFQIGKGVCQGCILSSCLFNYMQNTSCEMLGWMKHKLESRLPGEISVNSDVQMTPPLWKKVKKN